MRQQPASHDRAPGMHSPEQRRPTRRARGLVDHPAAGIALDQKHAEKRVDERHAQLARRGIGRELHQQPEITVEVPAKQYSTNKLNETYSI